MANLKVFFVVCLMGVCVYGTGDVGFPPQPSPDYPNSTTSAPPSPTTTPKPTIKPSPSPPSPNTTTSAPTPTPPPSPNTTTSAPTPTPSPTPTPAPEVANWTVNYENSNRSCIVLQVAAQYEILEPNSNSTVKLNVPKNATAAGSCEGENKQNLKLSWGQNNSLEFDFGKSNTSKFDLDEISAVFTSGSNVYNLVHNKTEFSTPLANSYKCAREQTLNFTEANSNKTIAYLHVSHLQYQAFRNTTEHKFDSALDCEGYVTPDIVPIVVGCVLAVLVVVVLAAYLIGRRRCQARGYLSM